jgi:hypothetical protein
VSNNWVVQNLQNALSTWNDKLSEIWQLLTLSITDFKGGGIWAIILNIHSAVQAIGLALVVLFFLMGIIKTCSSLSEFKRPEVVVKALLRFCIAKALVTHGLELMMTLLGIIQGIITKIMTSGGFAAPPPTTLPSSIVSAIENCDFWSSIPLWAVTLIGGLFIWVLSFVMILTVYGRFFKLYMYTAISPISLAAFAGEPTQSIGVSFIKSYAAVCLEGAIIVLACIIFSVFAATPPAINTSAAAVTMVWTYIGELIFNMLVLTGTIKMSDRVVREMMGV